MYYLEILNFSQVLKSERGKYFLNRYFYKFYELQNKIKFIFLYKKDQEFPLNSSFHRKIRIFL